MLSSRCNRSAPATRPAALKGLAPAAIAATLAATLVAGCGGGSAATAAGTSTSGAGRSSSTRATTKPGAARSSSSRSASTSSVAGAAASTAARRPSWPAYPQLLAAATSTSTTPGFVPAVRWQGHTSAWIARTSSGLALLSFDQRFLTLHLHAGAGDPGGSGWRFGPSIAGAESHALAAAFNGGFKFSTGAGGFESYGRIAVAPQSGLGSIVTYADGTTDIGAWHQGVPAPGRRVVSVRQNLTLLINHGVATSNAGCLLCWGATLGGVVDPARSALGITADGHLIWVGGEHLTVSALASALLAARVVRAVELDINPEWVNAYLYGHRGGHGPLAPVSVVPGQNGIPGEFLAPWGRDFFAVVAR